MVAPLIGLPLCVLGICGFSVAIWADVALTCPPSRSHPRLARFMGRPVWLEPQANCIGLAFFVICAVSAMKHDAPALDHIIVRMYPLVYMNGCVLTIGYFMFEHFNAEACRRRRVWAERGYPHTQSAIYLIHVPGFVLAMLLSATLRYSLSSFDVALVCGGFLFYYTYLCALNRAVTGEWPYECLTQVERSSGRAGVALALLGTFASGIAWGFLGKLVAER